MKKFLYLFAFVALTMSTLISCGGNGVNNFNIKRGTNLSHWLSQSRQVGE